MHALLLLLFDVVVPRRFNALFDAANLVIQVVVFAKCFGEMRVAEFEGVNTRAIFRKFVN